MRGFGEYFNVALGSQLLYDLEKLQYKEVLTIFYREWGVVRSRFGEGMIFFQNLVVVSPLKKIIVTAPQKMITVLKKKRFLWQKLFTLYKRKHIKQINVFKVHCLALCMSSWFSLARYACDLIGSSQPSLELREYTVNICIFTVAYLWDTLYICICIVRIVRAKEHYNPVTYMGHHIYSGNQPIFMFPLSGI